MVNITDTPDVLVSTDEPTPDDPSGRVHLDLAMHPEMFRSLADLARQSGVPLDTVIAKAFVLYRAAAKASREGKAVGIAPSGDTLKTEFVGF